MNCPNCETELTRGDGTKPPTWYCTGCTVRIAVLNPEALTPDPDRRCDVCRWFDRGKCLWGHAMQFRLPGSDPHDDTAGYHRFECSDFIPCKTT